MSARDRVDPAKTRQVVLALADWLRDETLPAPDTDVLAAAVRLTARTLAALAPGASVEVGSHRLLRCSAFLGPGTLAAHPNVVQTDPRTWLLVATGLSGVAQARGSGALQLSGSRAGEIEAWLPLVDLG